MSLVKVSGNASGTGTLTVAAPNTNTDRTLTLPDATGTLVSSSSLSNPVWPAPVDVQTFNSTGTWTKPTGGQTMARVQIWGGGGGGSRSTSAGGAAGGGGGAYNEVTIPLSYLASSFTATVGSGGTGATTAVNGGNGGNSSIPVTTAVYGLSTVTAYGGGGGNTGGIGGGGGGLLTAGNIDTAGTPVLATIWNGGYGGDINVGAQGQASLFGGAGGGRGAATVALSAFGGNGGVNTGGAGTAPGGGGGSASVINANGGNGAAGRIIVTCW